MNKVDMSLDDIIKMQKKQKQARGKPMQVAGKANLKQTKFLKQQVLQKKFPKQKQQQLQQQQTQQRFKPKPNSRQAQALSNPRNKRRLQQTTAAASPQRPRVNAAKRQAAPAPKKSLQAIKAQKLQQRVDQRRRLQQNRMKVNRPGSVASTASTLSDAKLLKLAKALLLKKTGANMLDSPTAEVAYSARQLKRQQNNLVTSPAQKRGWNRMSNSNRSNQSQSSNDSLITVSVKNELANTSGPRRRRLRRPGPGARPGPAHNLTDDTVIMQTISNPAAMRQPPQPLRGQPLRGQPVRGQPVQRGQPAISDIVKSMRPKVEMSYDFSKDVFSQAKTGVGLSQRFSSSSSSQPAGRQQGQPGTRQVYI